MSVIEIPSKILSILWALNLYHKPVGFWWERQLTSLTLKNFSWHQYDTHHTNPVWNLCILVIRHSQPQQSSGELIDLLTRLSQTGQSNLSAASKSHSGARW
mgnify:CR=1 FL=1